jgi:hypothetical protein
VNRQIFKWTLVVILFSFAYVCNADQEESERIRRGDYCECVFYDKPNLNQKLYVGWPGSLKDQKPMVRIEGKEYVGFEIIFEDFHIPINSPGRFLLSSELGKIKGKINVTSNCIGDLSGKCENVGMSGKIMVILNGVSKTYKVVGGCGC